ncbi:MAG: hypothetical protein ACPG8W_10230 [Candidatus Promineifilaceae bacterium]
MIVKQFFRLATNQKRMGRRWAGLAVFGRKQPQNTRNQRTI